MAEQEQQPVVAEGAEGAPQAKGAWVEGVWVEEKKKRGKPKDEHAPPKPRNPYGKFAGDCRVTLKETRPELISDLSAMGKAIAEEWTKVSDEEKARLQTQYDKEMVVWKPLWAEYKTTNNYKEFVEVKTDYLDKRAQKKLVKTMNKDAPKRPKSGYMIFAGSVREEVMEKVKAEGLGLGDAGKMISDRWALLTEGQKGEYGEVSQRQKITFDKEFGVYKMTDAFGNFQDAKAKLESSQQQKKLIRTHLDEAPKRSPSSYAMFRSEVMPDIVKENEGLQGDAKMSMGDMGKKLAKMWQEVSEEKKAEYAVTADALKLQYDKDFKAFKANQKYTMFLEKRQKVKARENLLVHLREMPKRPKSVFAMFSADHKSEVPAGKGEGKGTSALKVLFAGAEKEEKTKYEVKNAELTEEWKNDVVEFKAGPKYKTFEATKAKIILEFKNEAMKVTTFKFLEAAPPAPAKTAFAVYVGEKRKASGQPEGQRKTKEQKREEVVKAKEEWMKEDKAVRDGFEDKRKDLLKAYEESVRTFMAGETWQEYQKEAKRLRIPIKSLMYHKKAIIKKTKDGKVSPASIVLPEKPDLWPTKPRNAIQIFTAEKKQTVDSVAEIHEMWKNLSPEDKAPFDAQAAEQVKKFAEEMQAFRKSDEGRKYVRDLACAQRRRRSIAAKNNFLDDLPKKPTSAVFDWMKKNLKKVKVANPEAKGFELKKKLEETWGALTDEDKEPFLKAATEKMEKFTTDMQEFKASDNWKKYCNATKVRKLGGGGGGGKGPAAPDTMPKKPLNAMQTFMQEQNKSGMSAEIIKQFGALEEEEKKRLTTEANERLLQFKTDMNAFEQSPAGRRFRQMSKSFVKNKRMRDLKARFLKDEPKKPQGAFAIFTAENRQKIAEENPELKGTGPVQGKIMETWKAMDLNQRQIWTDKEKEEKEAYSEKLQAFQASDDYKKYRRLSVALLGMGKAKAKGKSGGGGGGSFPMPPAPANFPKKPMNGFFLFGEKQRASGQPGGLKDINNAWQALGKEGQKKYSEESEALKSTYETDMATFRMSAEGKKYLRLKMVAEKRNRLSSAKAKFLGGADQPKEPKRPQSSYFIFLGEKNETVTGMSGQEKAKALTAMWTNLPAEDKKVFEDKAKAQRETYDEDLKVYRASPGYIAYNKTLNAVSGSNVVKVQRDKANKAAKEKMAKPAKVAKVASAGRGRGAGAAGRGRGAAKPAPKAGGGADSNSDQMGSDSSSSSKSKSSSSSKSKSSASD